MNTYGIKRVTVEPGDISGKRFSPVYGDFVVIDDYPWGDSYTPDARACVQWDDNGLWVTMCAMEERVSAHETRFGGPVCRDSCLEFFVNPCPTKQKSYINIEVNPRGTAHIGVGPDRAERRVLTEMPKDMCLSASGHIDGRWAVRYRLTHAFMREMCGYDMEDVLAGNFYTCDESIHPHFGTWSPVRAAAPDFHRPEYFGRLELIR